MMFDNIKAFCFSLIGGYSRGFLTAMLKSMQTQGNKRSGIGIGIGDYNTVNTAFIAKSIRS
jgi:hypothetical protein